MTNALKMTAPEVVPFIDCERQFDFPVKDVFHAHKDPELLPQWLGPRRMKLELVHFDFRTGGSYRYIHTGPDGVPHEFRGVFHTVRENEFVLQTFEFAGYPDVVSLESLVFEDLGRGRSLMRAHAIYPSLDARNAMLLSGMESGITEAYERLDELLTARNASP